MNIKVNKKKLLLQEIYDIGAALTGNTTLDRTIFGFGGDRQLIKKDAQVEKIRKQEESEINQNIKDQQVVNESQKINVDKNIKTIKKYLNLLRHSKPGDSVNFAAKIDFELKDLEQKLKMSETAMTFGELSNIINEIIESELKK